MYWPCKAAERVGPAPEGVWGKWWTASGEKWEVGSNTELGWLIRHRVQMRAQQIQANCNKALRTGETQLGRVLNLESLAEVRVRPGGVLRIRIRALWL